MSGSVSRSLPRDTPGFLNRDDEIVEVTARLGDESSTLVWLTGPAGVGKTCLAVRLGHQLGDRFSDGVLYAELHGTDPAGPAQPADILRRFLRQLGKQPEDIPEELDDRAADFRALTHDKRVLVILDDAFTAAQVRILTPSSPRSAVIVTSRKHLDGLVFAGFTEVPVTEFSQETAIALLGQIVDTTRLEAEPAAAVRLVDGCAGLPLAVRILGAWLASRSRRTLAWFADRFAEAPLTRLRLDDDLSVKAIFDLRYDELDGDMKRAYGLLGTHARPHLDAPAAAAILDLPDEDATDILDDLVSAYLLRPFDPGRYRFHPLVADHARARAEEMPATSLEETARRHVTYRRLRAAALAKVVSPRWTVASPNTIPAYTGPDAVARAHAELELDEPLYRAAVVSADQFGMDEDCAAIAEALKPWYYNTGRVGHLTDVLRVAVPAADRTGDPALAMHLHNDFGSACEGAGEFDNALAEYELSRRFAEQCGHQLGLASAVEGAGLTQRGRGEHDVAVRHYDEARVILSRMTPTTQEDSEQVERALVLLDLHRGTELGLLNRPEEGEDDLRRARTWFADHGELVNEGRAMLALASVYRHRGELDQAADQLSAAGVLFETAGFGPMHAESLVSLAGVERARDDAAAARELLTRAHAQFERLGRWRRATEVAELLVGS